MPKFISWLVWEGYLDRADYELAAPKDRPKKISRALEDYLRDLYWHMGEPSHDSPPQYAAGSFGEQYHAMRDLPHHVRPIKNKQGQIVAFECDPVFPVPDGLLAREGATWNWILPSNIAYLATGLVFFGKPYGRLIRATVMCFALSPCPQQDVSTAKRGTLTRMRLRLPLTITTPRRKASADLLDEALADAFDDEGYEQD